MVKIKRVYDPPESSDGTRILVMRLWPRGIRRERVDEWNRDVAPSVDLLHAFKREGLPWERYVKGYWKEIAPEAVDALRRRRMSSAAIAFLKAHSLLGYPARFDIVEVVWPLAARCPEIRHHPNAFPAEGHGQFFR